ncbi:MAG: hypothetical protein IKX65_07875 [Prevotella sp.]|nr:hypothetical protein [Prevotella sp.]
MKKYSLFKGLVVLAAMFTSQQALAQQVDMNTGLVVWKGSTAEAVAASGEFFYLVQWKDQLSVNDKEQYVGASGDYGVQAVISPVGMRMQLQSVTANTLYYLSNRNTSAPYYQLITRIRNADTTSDYLGDRMSPNNDDNAGSSIYLDRSNQRAYWEGDHRNVVNFPNWKLVESTSTKRNVRYKGETSSHTQSVTTYIFQNVESQNGDGTNTNNYRAMYIRVNSQGKLVTTFTRNEATKFIIVSETDFDHAMGDVTWGEVDLGVFVQDASFGRDNKDGIYWVWETNGEGDDPETNENGMTLDGRQLTGDNIHWHQRNQDVMCNGVELSTRNITREKIGRNVATSNSYNHDEFRANFGEYYAAEIYNEVNSLTQTLRGATIPNLVDGLYKLTAQALYDDDENHNTNDHVSYFVVTRRVPNGDGTYTETTEEMPVKPILNEDLGSTITRHSGVSAGYVFNNNPKAYLLTTFVEINGETELTIGIKQKVAKGWTVIGNVHLYAHGKQALLVDEDWETKETIHYMVGDQEQVAENVDPYTTAKWYDNYDYPATVYYQRTFAVEKWNTICLPLSLTGRQVRQAFGEDAKVCAFIGQLNGDPDGCILFSRSVDLDQDENMDKYVIQAGTPYIIYVSKFPQHPNGMSVEVGNGNTNELNHTLEIDGASYSIPGVIKDQYTEWQKTVNGQVVLKDPTDVTYTDAKYKTDLHFVGSFYHKVIDKSTIHGSANASGSNDYWIITKGDMYHLTGAKDWNIWATYAYLYRPVGNGSPAKALSFAIDDGYGIQEIATSIEGLYVVSEENNVEDYEIYNLSGTKVGKGTLDTLPKGIYIMNGKKYVKK